MTLAEIKQASEKLAKDHTAMKPFCDLLVALTENVERQQKEMENLQPKISRISGGNYG